MEHRDINCPCRTGRGEARPRKARLSLREVAEGSDGEGHCPDIAVGILAGARSQVVGSV